LDKIREKLAISDASNPTSNAEAKASSKRPQRKANSHYQAEKINQLLRQVPPHLARHSPLADNLETDFTQKTSHSLPT